MKPSDYIEKGWCKDGLAYNGDNMLTGPCGRDAVKWCSLGAVIASYPSNELEYRKVVRAIEVHVGLPIAHWNDRPERTKKEVIAAFKAIGQ